MATAQSMILTVYKRLGVADKFATLVSNEEYTFALEILNTMIDSWEIERNLIYQVLQRSLSWPAATTSRTIGSGGDFSVTRPDTIDSAYVTVDGDEYPVHVLRDRRHYDQISDKGAAVKIPDYLFYDPGMATGTLYLWGVPTDAVTLLLNVWQVLQTFDLTETLSLPKGYQRAIEWSLAEELLADYPQDPRTEATIQRMAAKSRLNVKRINSPESTMATEVGLMTSRLHANILTGV